MNTNALAIAATTPLMLLIQSCGSAAGQPTPTIQPAAEVSFSQFDADSSGDLDRSEILDLQADIFEHVDRLFDDKLLANEYRGYTNLLETIAQNRTVLPAGLTVHQDIAYVEGGHHRQLLDLYLPSNADPSKPLPLVIWIYGGGWHKGTKAQFTFQSGLLEKGFAVAAINYRLTRHAAAQDQIHDSNAAIRYLRANAERYGLDPERFGVWGSSAGGHLASLVAAGSDIPALQGQLGTIDISSRTQAAMIWHGPSDMFKMFEFVESQKPNVNWAKQPLHKLFDGLPETKASLIKLGSPVNHITTDDPPFFMMHADGDPIVPLNQSEILQERLRAAGVSAELHIVRRDIHGAFTDSAELELVSQFFEQHPK